MTKKTKTPTSWIAIAVVVWCGHALALEPQSLSALLEYARAEQRMPGLRAAIRYPDGRIVRAAVGLGDKESGTLLDDAVGMPGGSTGKTFVAAVTMLWVEDGTLSLDDPASKWLGDTDWFARLPNAEDIKVRHLLSHSSGIPDYPSTTGFHTAMIWRVIRNGSAKFEPEELKRFGHAGLWPGYRTQVIHYASSGLTVAVQTNRDGRVELDKLIARLAAAAEEPE